MGIAFGQGGHAGLLLTAPLTVELAFLGLSIVDAMTEGGRSNREAVVATGSISLLTADELPHPIEADHATLLP